MNGGMIFRGISTRMCDPREPNHATAAMKGMRSC